MGLETGEPRPKGPFLYEKKQKLHIAHHNT